MWALLIMAAIVLQGCGLVDSINNLTGEVATSTDKAVSIMDGAIASLADESADWQIVVQDAINQLTDEAHTFLRNDLNNLLQRAPANVGTEFKCSVDFLRKRVRQELIYIKAKFLGLEVPDKEPSLCTVVPLAVDASFVPDDLRLVEFYGYDFDTVPVEVLLRSGGQDQDVSRFLDRPTPYHLTLNLGANGVQLSSTSERFILRWKGETISTIGILQPGVPICGTKHVDFRPDSLSFVPSHTRGDREYAGNGPDVTVAVALSHTQTGVSAEVSMTAAEVGGDHTTASGSETFSLNYVPEPGWVISQILSTTESQFDYRDDDTNDDVYPGSGPVASYTFIGDTKGDDVGETGVKIEFVPNVTVELTENTNCVSPLAVRTLELQGLISAPLLASFRSQIRGEVEISPSFLDRFFLVVPGLEVSPGILTTPTP
jgi:hypothetical protein